MHRMFEVKASCFQMGKCCRSVNADDDKAFLNPHAPCCLVVMMSRNQFGKESTGLL